jgi:hypothetical protein
MELNDALGGAAAPRPVLEVLDRDGQVRQSHRITHWPLTVGRALDNDLTLSDPYIAAHHLRIQPLSGNGDDDGGQAAGLRLEVLDSLNGVRCGRRRVNAGQFIDLTDDSTAQELQLGRTRVRLRLPPETLADELPLPSNRSRMQRFAPIFIAAVVALLGLGFNVWLESDPDNFGKRIASTLMSVCTTAAVWCGLWVVLTKVFTRQAQFGWHLKVLLFATVVWLALLPALDLLAFSLSWPWVSSFSFIVGFAIIAAMLYHHLLALEIARPRTLRVLGVSGLLVGTGIALWSHQQSSGNLGSELYMSHLFPPALRLARAQPVDAFVDSLAPLQERLDAKAQKAREEDSEDDDSDD